MVERGRSDSPAVLYCPELSALSPDTGLARLISTPITQGFMGKQQLGPKVRMRKERKAENREMGRSGRTKLHLWDNLEISCRL